MTRWILVSIATILALVFFTPYRYEHIGENHLVRINRITGDAALLSRNGWRAMEPKEP